MKTNYVPPASGQGNGTINSSETYSADVGVAARASWQCLGGRFTEALGLTPQQLVSIQPAFDKAEAQFGLLQVEASQKTQRVLYDTMAEIRPFLSEQQCEILELCTKISKAVSEARIDRDPRKQLPCFMPR